MKELSKATATAIISVLITLLLMEGILRLLPVNGGLRTQPVNAEAPIYHFEPNRVAQYSSGWNFANKNQVRVNNYGFVSGHDYDPMATTPLLAIIGDSYIEAQMVPFEQTVTGRLQKTIGGSGRVYALAASGAGLSQYMVWAKYARDTFRPDSYVFVIVGNDFKDSLTWHRQKPGFHTFARSGDGWRVVRADYRPSLLRRIVRNSALAMYIFTNLKVHARFGFSQAHATGKLREDYIGNVEAIATKELLRDSKWAARIFLDNLPKWTGVGRDRIAFVIDGIRPQLYSEGGVGTVAESYWSKMRRYFIIEAEHRGYETIDMQPRFIERYARTGKRFEFPNDGHWSGEGHLAASDAVVQSRQWLMLFAR